MEIKFCNLCGGSVSWKIPEGDSHHRHVCDNCGFIQYQNPKIVAGCIVHQGDAILLCKRAIEPRLGYWTLPAGFMENGETTKQGAERETFEETGARISAGKLFAITNSPRVNHVNMFYLAELNNQSFHPTSESTEVELMRKSDIPFDDIAFHTVAAVLDRYFSDFERGEFGLHEIDF